MRLSRRAFAHRPVYFKSLRLVGSLGCGTTGGTCELYGADNGVAGVHQLEALEVEVTDGH